MKGLKAFLLVALASCAALVPMQAASAGTASKTGTTWVTVNDHWYKVATTTATKIKTAPWTMTKSELAQIGQTPGKAHAPKGMKPPTIVAVQPGTANPMAVGKCVGLSPAVCINVYGSGLYISAWDSAYYRSVGPYLCAYSTNVWDNGAYWDNTTAACGTYVFLSYWSPARNFQPGYAFTYYTFEQTNTHSASVWFNIHS